MTRNNSYLEDSIFQMGIGSHEEFYSALNKLDKAQLVVFLRPLNLLDGIVLAGSDNEVIDVSTEVIFGPGIEIAR
jgi:hypothetical protein